LSQEINAEILMILTDVEHVMLNYGDADEVAINQMTVDEAEKYLQQGHFGEGSMKPKIEACVNFAKVMGRKAIIAPLNKTLEALQEKAGTIIIP